MTIYAIDPGPVKSALVTLHDDGTVEASTWPNQDLHAILATADPGILVIEMIASYGMPVGAEVFQTCVWIGRFYDTWDGHGVNRQTATSLTRLQVKSAICHSGKANDANIRAALIDRFGGPSCIRKGGALYKVKGDEWAALAVACAYRDAAKEKANVDCA
mgnify:CR=1 FL=1